MITEEEFAAWREDPVTEWVCAELAKAADAQKAAWMAMSWGEGMSDGLQLHVLKTRADAYRALAEITFQDLAEIVQ